MIQTSGVSPQGDELLQILFFMIYYRDSFTQLIKEIILKLALYVMKQNYEEWRSHELWQSLFYFLQDGFASWQG